MNIQGKIYKIFEEKKISDTFKKREFVLDYTSNSNYPQYIKMEFSQDNCSKLNGLKVGDSVSIEFDLRGREWQSPKTGEVMYFNTLSAWKIEKTGDGQSEQPYPDSSSSSEFVPPASTGDNDDLPF